MDTTHTYCPTWPQMISRVSGPITLWNPNFSMRWWTLGWTAEEHNLVQPGPLHGGTEACTDLKFMATCDSTSSLAFNSRVGCSSMVKKIREACKVIIDEYKHEWLSYTLETGERCSRST